MAYLVGGLLTGLVVVGIVLRAARHLGVLAHPNERSSHRVPTPVLGGIGIVVPVVAVLLVSAAGGVSDAGAVAAAGVILAVVGLWDDLRDLSAAFRLVVQGGAVTLLLAQLGSDWLLPVGLLVGVIVLWNVNVFNFMDGVDGIAAVQTLIFCTGVLLIGDDITDWPAHTVYVLVGACFGFLAYNWPPAEIFMGDVSSGFLGLLTASLAIVLDQSGAVPIVSSIILLAGFWFDASYTLAVRVVTRQRFMQAHRSHLYQHVAAIVGHRWTTLAFLLHGLLWLLPNAALVASRPELTVLWLALAIAPLAFACWYFGAGFPEGRKRVIST